MDLFLAGHEIEDPVIRKIVHENSKHTDGYIYFIACRSFVKVGFATDVKQRLANIKTSTPYEVTLERSFPGTLQDERRLHQLLRPHRVKLEWFKYNDALENIIDDLYDYQCDVLFSTLRPGTETSPEIIDMIQDVPICGFWGWLERMQELENG